MISHKHKFVYIHVPKCGGTSLRGKINPYCEIRANFKSGTYNYHKSVKDLKNHFIDLGHTNISEEIIQEKCISVWAFQHGIVGILRKNAIAEDLGVAKERGAMSAISSLSNNFDDYLSKSINNLLTI